MANRTALLEARRANKYADNRYPIEEVLRRRCSTLSFSEQPVEVEKLQSAIEAARWAPSSYNEQPWRFLVTTKTETPDAYDRLLACLSPHNRQWAHKAPVLMLAAARVRFSHNANANRHAFHDVGLALGNLTIQASAMDLFVHMAAGFDATQARESFAIPEDYEPLTVLVLGYLGDLDDLPASLRERETTPRKRKPFRSFVFSNRWGEPVDWLE